VPTSAATLASRGSALATDGRRRPPSQPSSPSSSRPNSRGLSCGGRAASADLRRQIVGGLKAASAFGVDAAGVVAADGLDNDPKWVVNKRRALPQIHSTIQHRGACFLKDRSVSQWMPGDSFSLPDPQSGNAAQQLLKAAQRKEAAWTNAQYILTQPRIAHDTLTLEPQFVEWQRLGHVFSPHARRHIDEIDDQQTGGGGIPLWNSHGPMLADVTHPGDHGGPFWSVVALLVSEPRRIQRVVSQPANDVFALHFHSFEGRRPVYVDAWVPCLRKPHQNENGWVEGGVLCPLFNNIDKGVIWPAILEKGARSSPTSSYGSMVAWDVGNTLRALAGPAITCVECRSGEGEPSEVVQATVQSALSKGYVVAAVAMHAEDQRQTTGSFGLLDSHAYRVVGTAVLQPEEQVPHGVEGTEVVLMLQLRRNAWRGQAQGWRHDLSRSLSLSASQMSALSASLLDESCGWVPMDLYFNKLLISHSGALSEEQTQTTTMQLQQRRFPTEPGSCWIGSSYFLLEVHSNRDSPRTCCLTLSQRDLRWQRRRSLEALSAQELQAMAVAAGVQVVRAPHICSAHCCRRETNPCGACSSTPRSLIAMGMSTERC
jgi:hypothetical protein